MAIILRRQLTESEKQQVLANHGRKCFATGHPIDEQQPIQFDHIRAFSEGGLSEIQNIAPMCETHNRSKGVLPLDDFRVKLRLNAFFAQGDSLTLKHLLAHLKKQGDLNAYGGSIVISQRDGEVDIETPAGRQTYDLYSCPTTGWKYFYATLPIDVLDSDDEEDDKAGLQPRFLIPDKVFELYRHFQRHPVLQPSIGRVHHQSILLFDGQHKVAALLWNGRRSFESKIYLSLDRKLMNQTNIAAHDKFSQTRFYSSVMVLKLGTEFGREFDIYKNLEDGLVKSEAGFMRFLEKDPSLAMSRSDRNRRFRSYLYNSVLQDPSNKLGPFVSTGNRSSDEKPLTIDMLSRSLFAGFLYMAPVEDNMATETYRRDREVANNVELMNMLYDLALGAWNPKAGGNDSAQRRLVRLFRSKSIMAWSELLRDAVCGKLDLQDAEERARPFYRELSSNDVGRIRSMVERLVNWSFWDSPLNSEIDRVLADNKSVVKESLRNQGLTTGYLMGAGN